MSLFGLTLSTVVSNLSFLCLPCGFESLACTCTSNSGYVGFRYIELFTGLLYIP